MVDGDNLSRKPEPRYDLIKHEECCSFLVINKCHHDLDPLSKLVDGHNDVTMPPSRCQVKHHEIYPPLGEEAGCNNEKHGRDMCAHFISEYLIWVTLLNHFITIFEDRGKKVPNVQNILGCFQPI